MTPWTTVHQARILEWVAISFFRDLSYIAFIFLRYVPSMEVPSGAGGKEFTCQCRKHETWVQSLGQEDPLEKGMTTHSSILAWRILWTEEPGGLQSIRSQKVRYD